MGHLLHFNDVECKATLTHLQKPIKGVHHNLPYVVYCKCFQKYVCHHWYSVISSRDRKSFFPDSLVYENNLREESSRSIEAQGPGLFWEKAAISESYYAYSQDKHTYNFFTFPGQN